jgi:hypothetical protein
MPSSLACAGEVVWACRLTIPAKRRRVKERISFFMIENLKFKKVVIYGAIFRQNGLCFFKNPLIISIILVTKTKIVLDTLFLR